MSEPVEVGKPIQPIEWKRPAGVSKHPLPAEATVLVPETEARLREENAHLRAELVSLRRRWANYQVALERISEIAHRELIAHPEPRS